MKLYCECGRAMHSTLMDTHKKDSVKIVYRCPICGTEVKQYLEVNELTEKED